MDKRLLLFHIYDPICWKLIHELASNKWDHKYEREEAAYPSEFLKAVKYWPPVGRVDNVYGDKNLFCTCPSMDEYEDTAA